MPTPSPERRRAPRAKAAFPIQIGPADQTRPARLRDLSEVGLCCVSGTAVAEMTSVAIDMQLPGDKARHRVQGAVVRCQRIRGSSPAEYEVAVYFMDANAAAKAAIRGYVGRGEPA